VKLSILKQLYGFNGLESETYRIRQTADGVEHAQKLPACIAVMLDRNRRWKVGEHNELRVNKKESLGQNYKRCGFKEREMQRMK
jgi:hypothetical protein